MRNSGFKCIIHGYTTKQLRLRKMRIPLGKTDKKIYLCPICRFLFGLYALDGLCLSGIHISSYIRKVNVSCRKVGHDELSENDYNSRDFIQEIKKHEDRLYKLAGGLQKRDELSKL